MNKNPIFQKMKEHIITLSMLFAGLLANNETLAFIGLLLLIYELTGIMKIEVVSE